MSKLRKLETSEERNQRVKREAQMKTERAATDEAAIDRMIRLNIEQYGP